VKTGTFIQNLMVGHTHTDTFRHNMVIS